MDDDYEGLGYDERGVKMTQECCSVFDIQHRPDGGVAIRIDADPRFATLWLLKLTDLRATDAEIAEHEWK